MGLNVSGISRSGDPNPPRGNPLPWLFVIKYVTEVGTNLVATIKYPGVTNYEGEKILVYLDRDEAWLRAQDQIDPHFSESGGPFARFEPTEKGKAAAITLARSLSYVKL